MKKRRTKSPPPRRHRQPSPRQVAWRQLLASFPPPLRQAVVQAAQSPQVCLLCKQPATQLGVFLPYAPDAWGVPPGWRAARIYALCAACRALPDCLARVEAAIWQHRAHWASKAAAFWN